MKFSFLAPIEGLGRLFAISMTFSRSVLAAQMSVPHTQVLDNKPKVLSSAMERKFADNFQLS